MRLVSHAEERLVRPIERAFDAAVDDTLELARAEARKHRRSGRFERSLIRTSVRDMGTRLEARIGSPLRSARAKEKGAFIQAKRGPYLVFPTNDGWRKVESVRLAPQPVVTPAGRRFRQVMAARLRQVLRP